MARGSFLEKSAIAIQSPIKTSVKSAVILNAGKIKAMISEIYPAVIMKGTSGTAAKFAINAVKGNLPKEKHSEIMVKT